MSISKKIVDAATVWNNLNGIINIYKPSGVKLSHIRNTIIANACRDLNKLIVRRPRYRVNIEAATQTQFKVKVEEDLADNILVVGERYQMEDIRCAPAATLGPLTSGVLLLGINDGIKLTSRIHINRPIRVYHISGRFGIATETNFLDSRIISRATYGNIYLEKINQLAASMQASHQKKMFEQCGVDLQSQTSYDLAVKGTIRPNSFKIPILYGIKCIEYKKPNFILEIHALNENENYFGTLCHEIGLQLRTVAHCTKIRCIRHGPFNLDHTILRGNWNLQEIITNMSICNQILEKHPNLLKNQYSDLQAV